MDIAQDQVAHGFSGEALYSELTGCAQEMRAAFFDAFTVFR
jgi:hypothetical protein